MSELGSPTAIAADQVALRTTQSNYPALFAARMAGREKRALGDVFGLANFGVNHTHLAPGMCAGFKAGTGNGHQLLNRTNADVVYLEVGDRTPGDAVTYPDDDLMATSVGGVWQFAHKDGRPY